MSKTNQVIINVGKKAAIKNTEFLCRLWFHQPKVPTRLLELKNAK